MAAAARSSSMESAEAKALVMLYNLLQTQGSYYLVDARADYRTDHIQCSISAPPPPSSPDTDGSMRALDCIAPEHRPLLGKKGLLLRFFVYGPTEWARAVSQALSREKFCVHSEVCTVVGIGGGGG